MNKKMITRMLNKIFYSFCVPIVPLPLCLPCFTRMINKVIFYSFCVPGNVAYIF